MKPRAHARWSASRLGAWVLVLGLVLPAVARPAGEAPAPEQSPSPGPTNVRELEAFLDGVMREQLEAYRIPGAVIAVVKDGRLLLAKGYGYSNLERREPVIAERTLFRIGSVSKLFTWTAVMQLAEQGRLDLDADVNTYLHDFQIPATWHQPITLRHLLCHTAGFEEWLLPITVSSADELEPLGKLLTRSMPARVHPPGEVGAYSNYGATLAGYIIEQVSGMPFERYIEENILKPLDMRHSAFQQPLPAGLAPDMSTGYLIDGGLPLATPFELLRMPPAGAMTTTATDMAKFMVAHLQNGRYGDNTLLSEDMAKRMHSRLFAYDPRLTGGCAYGFGMANYRGQWMLEHGGGTNIISSDLVLLPDRNVGLFVAYNSQGEGTTGDPREDLWSVFIDHYYPPPLPTKPTPMPGAAQRVSRFTGTYQYTRRPYTTFAKLGHLGQELQVKPGPDGSIFVKEAGGTPRRWVEVEPLLFRLVDGWPSATLLAFREDAHGHITGLAIGADVNAYERQPWYERAPIAYGWLAVCMGLFLSVLVGWPFGLILRRCVRRDPPSPPRPARVARWVAGTACALGLLFLPAFLFLSIPGFLHGGPHPVMTAVLTLGLVFAVLAACTVVFAALAWKQRYWSMSGRVHYSLAALATVAFVWWMHVWNLLGFRY